VTHLDVSTENAVACARKSAVDIPVSARDASPAD
jgi:hypothetical protein